MPVWRLTAIDLEHLGIERRREPPDGPEALRCPASEPSYGFRNLLRKLREYAVSVR